MDPLFSSFYPNGHVLFTPNKPQTEKIEQELLQGQFLPHSSLPSPLSPHHTASHLPFVPTQNQLSYQGAPKTIQGRLPCC